MMRFTVSAASTEWTVDITRWPVSAADSAVRTVSSSRISPTRITSGSWRSTRRRARLKELVSSPTSRWLMIDILSLCRNSTGSSIVTMCFAVVVLMRSIMAARVVDLPEPVVPVSRITPRSSSAMSLITGGSMSSSTLLILKGIARQTIEIDPRCLKAFTRKRATPGTAYEKSTSCSLSNSSSRSGSLSIARKVCSVASGVRGSAPGIGSSLPWLRINGGEGTLRCRSEPLVSITRRNACSKSNIW